MGVGGQRHSPAALPPGKTRYPLYGRLGGLQGRSGRMRKISPPPGFDPRTVQPVASRYTDWAIPAPNDDDDDDDDDNNNNNNVIREIQFWNSLYCCKISGSHSVATKDSRLPAYYAASDGKYLPTS